MQSTRIRRQNRLSLKVTCTTTEGSAGGWNTADEVKKVATTTRGGGQREVRSLRSLGFLRRARVAAVEQGDRRCGGDQTSVNPERV